MVQWGFIGCGAVTEKKSGPAFRKIEGSDVVAVMRRDGEKAKEYAQRHLIDRWYDNAEELIHDPGVNAVYIATPPGSHAAYAIEAMRAGKPVYVEKPMAATWAECREMNRVSEETGVPLFVAYYRRTLPYFLRVKQLISEGALGELSTVEIRFAIPPYQSDYDREHLPWRVKKELAGGGYFYDLASHQLDLLDFILGEITGAAGFTANIGGLYEVEDSLSAAFRFQKGMPGSGSWSFVAPPDSRTDKIVFTGRRGKLTCSTFMFTPIRLETSEGVKEYMEVNPENIQYYLIRSIVNYLDGNGTIPVSTGITAARTNRVMELISQGVGKE
ncbi:MAG: Gfo/Idh/MocA family oxidoreductase [Proteiniphilum sp.]|jgi:predicted dehydrogenase|nr:Gfo/Idh/MocA family oxidoreductase [Proteiniphilum sp.]HHT34315.1 Gfo/Idh/MocA family oxidoreductase [Bacteroidales bacterium]MDD2726084.1 Gfo/Idh/MocA family oxidoreductase [Proteiniphilum sp.]MDD3555780.1 Gfo/Idh/MocA family oxidoreductase [Proteiniphilum sp.]MDD4485504.1 Gfo/Idh/MocA family oxidoreductase [Proteiniphilum sp.]